MQRPDIEEVADLIRRYKALHERIETIQYAISTPSGIRYDKINVQTTPVNRLEAGVVQLEGLLKKADLLKAVIRAKTAQIRAEQEQTGKYTNDEWKVLQLRFICGLQYDQIEETTGYSYRKIRRLMGRIKMKNRS